MARPLDALLPIETVLETHIPSREMQNLRNARLLPRLLLAAGASILALIGTGCASAAKPENMIPATVEIGSKRPETVAIEIVGGQETNPLWTSEISGPDFAQAVEASIRQHGPFAGVDPASELLLLVELLSVDQPLVGFNMTVTVHARWTLKQKEAQEALWQEQLTTPHTATVGDAFAAIKRLRLANEGAARANIQAALQKLGATP